MASPIEDTLGQMKRALARLIEAKESDNAQATKEAEKGLQVALQNFQRIDYLLRLIESEDVPKQQSRSRQEIGDWHGVYQALDEAVKNPKSGERLTSDLLGKLRRLTSLDDQQK